MKKRGEGPIYTWTRLGGNLLQDRKKKIVIYVMYVIPHISNRILDFFWELPSSITLHWSSSMQLKNTPTALGQLWNFNELVTAL